MIWRVHKEVTPEEAVVPLGIVLLCLGLGGIVEVEVVEIEVEVIIDPILPLVPAEMPVRVVRPNEIVVEGYVIGRQAQRGQEGWIDGPNAAAMLAMMPMVTAVLLHILRDDNLVKEAVYPDIRRWRRRRRKQAEVCGKMAPPAGIYTLIPVRIQ